MEIQIKLYGSSKMLSENETLLIELPENSNIGQLRNSLKKLINEKYSKNNLNNLSNSAAFFSEKNEIINDNYKLKNKELISIIPPIGGG
jgi:molybdopterin converting factor small subunit